MSRPIPEGFTRNEPCDDGRKLGANLARHADNAEKRWREEMQYVPVRCSSCAFKEGTYPNGCLATVADATKCLVEGVPFYCHHKVKGLHPDERVPRTLCGGWILLNGRLRTKCPWPFSK